MKPTHDELNSLVSLCHDDEHLISIGMCDELYNGEPRFRIYNAVHACDSTESIEASLTRGQFFTNNPKGLPRSRATVELAELINEMVNRAYPIHGVTVWRMLCFVWNMGIGCFGDISKHLTGESGWDLLEAYRNGKFDTATNLFNPRYLPSTWAPRDYTEWNELDV